MTVITPGTKGQDRSSFSSFSANCSAQVVVVVFFNCSSVKVHLEKAQCCERSHAIKDIGCSRIYDGRLSLLCPLVALQARLQKLL